MYLVNAWLSKCRYSLIIPFVLFLVSLREVAYDLLTFHRASSSFFLANGRVKEAGEHRPSGVIQFHIVEQAAHVQESLNRCPGLGDASVLMRLAWDGRRKSRSRRGEPTSQPLTMVFLFFLAVVSRLKVLS